jgi:5-methylcytosine-specific restriction endonuclease McrA
MDTKILKLNKAGSPQAWINIEQAATAQSKGLVLWSLGERAGVLRGGYQVNGLRSRIELPAIIAVAGRVKNKIVPRMTNSMLFSRDDYLCLYCGGKFDRRDLSRDHVMPRSRGGEDTWENCVTACKRCNQRKADRTPEEANMQLLAVPFAPNLYEWFYLSNRHVLIDQMDYLQARFEHVSNV